MLVAGVEWSGVGWGGVEWIGSDNGGGGGALFVILTPNSPSTHPQLTLNSPPTLPPHTQHTHIQIRDSKWNDMKTSMYLLGNAFRFNQQKAPDSLPTVKAAKAFTKDVEEVRSERRATS